MEGGGAGGQKTIEIKIDMQKDIEKKGGGGNRGEK